MLRVANLKCFYGRIMALKGVSLSVEKGELITLIGANGSGKSTLLQAVCGLMNHWEGEIEFQDSSLKGLTPPSIVDIGISMVPEGRHIFPPLSVRDNLLLGAYTLCRKKGKKAALPEMERVFDLFPILKERAKQAAGTLSGGEQQMLAIGRALMARPKLLVLDEPSMGLAPLFVKRIFDTLGRLNSEGLTLLLVEQNASLALSLAHRGYVLETGSVVLQGRASDLMADEEVKRAYLGKDYRDFYEGRE